MTQTIHANYLLLKKEANNSYPEKRILSEIAYLMELLYGNDAATDRLMEQAVERLVDYYRENRQLDASVVKEVEESLSPLSEQAKAITAICVGHAHIDMNWMWGYQETVALVLDTMRTMLVLMEEYPDFKFSQSQASVYRMMEEYEPDMLEQVKRRIKEGRWEVTASTWVENDKNMSSGESMARQMLYAKQYLSNLLEIDEDTLNIDWEPDTFGHSYNLPEILRQGGVSRYFHLRGYDGERVYRWKGLSGAEVIAYCDLNHFDIVIDYDFCETMPAFCKKYKLNKVLQIYGVGDHGGGPTRRDLDRLLDMATWPLYPKIKLGTYKEYYDYLEENKELLPVVNQELNYVFTGCYTSQSRIKMANRIGEARLTEAEILDCMAKSDLPNYRGTKRLNTAWEKILFNQFHDIIPGSGVTETREYAMGQFQNAMAHAGAVGVHAMDAICGHISTPFAKKASDDFAMGGGVGLGAEYKEGYRFSQPERGGGLLRYYTLFNTTQVERTEPTEMILWDWQEDPSAIRITDLAGKEYPYQILEEGANWNGHWGHCFVRIALWMPVPPLGYTVCRVDVRERDSVTGKIAHLSESNGGGSMQDYITDEPICLENDKIKVLFDSKTMKCTSFVRKSDGRDWIVPTEEGQKAKAACSLAMITEETGNAMTSWRVGKIADYVDLNESTAVRPVKVETSGLRKRLEYDVSVKGCHVRVKIHLDEGSEFLDYRFEIRWTMLGDDQKGIPQLRFMLPCSYKADHYRYAIPSAILDRQPLAQDVPSIGLGCALPAEGGDALCMLSDSKYGFRGDHDGLSLNLIRGSYDPDPYPEIGDHIIRVAVGVCNPDKENLALLAERFIHPVTIRSCTGEAKVGSRSMLELTGGVLSAIKQAEDGAGYIVRVYNPGEEERDLKLHFASLGKEIYRCDIMEHVAEKIATEGETLRYRMRGYEVCSFRIQ